MDVSSYQPVVWVERDSEECHTVFVKKCEDAGKNLYVSKRPRAEKTSEHVGVTWKKSEGKWLGELTSSSHRAPPPLPTRRCPSDDARM